MKHSFFFLYLLSFHFVFFSCANDKTHFKRNEAKNEIRLTLWSICLGSGGKAEDIGKVEYYLDRLFKIAKDEDPAKRNGDAIAIDNVRQCQLYLLSIPISNCNLAPLTDIQLLTKSIVCPLSADGSFSLNALKFSL